jgi:hypothetical protein
MCVITLREKFNGSHCGDGAGQRVERAGRPRPLSESLKGDDCLPLGIEPVAYTKAVRATALPWNQHREQHAAASRSELHRRAACLNVNLTVAFVPPGGRVHVTAAWDWILGHI